MIVKDDKEILQSYLKDASNFQGNADAAYIPSDLQELTEIISDFYQEKKPFTISGAGTGLTGGRVPSEGVIISMERFNKILEIDYNQRLARVQSGVTLLELEEELKSKGYFFPPNPTEKNSSIGGNIANNASGSRTFKYGAYRYFVNELKVVLANGDILVLDEKSKTLKNNEITLVAHSGNIYKIPIDFLNLPDTKNAAGYYMVQGMRDIDLFIGSEGTLGVIAEVVLKILPEPEQVVGFMTFFENVDKMLNYVENIRNLSLINNKSDYRQVRGISARLIELFDKNALDLVRDKYPQIPKEAIACIWTEQELNAVNEDAVLNSWFSLIKDYTDLANDTWVSMNDKEHDKFREFRHSIPLKVVDTVAKNGFQKFGTDTAVPVDKFTEFYTFVVDKFNDSSLDYAIWGHIGNAHLHANLLPKTNKEFEKSKEIINLILSEAIRLKGTVSAEHGIGKLKKEFLPLMFGQKGVEAMKLVKNVLDPYYLLGRGNLFD